MSKSKYKQYPIWVKAAVSMTGRPDLFHDLDIPRTTANYWIKHGYTSDDPIVGSLTAVINESRSELNRLNKNLKEKEALMKLVQDVFEIFGFHLRWKHIDSADAKSRILTAIATAMNSASREACFQTIGLSLSRYKRWRREQRGCGLEEIKICPKQAGNQLTFYEVQTMKNLVTSTEYSHFPIRSLHYFAKREKILFCSYTTWRKYIDQYAWKRPRKKPRTKMKRVGLRAKRPNEIWHLDVSYFILPNKTKCFIQAIIDNYSRYVVAWQVLPSYDGSKTGALVYKAIERVLKKKSSKLHLIVDGGGENKSRSVTKLEEEGFFTKQVALFEISYSNSMVETLFRSLKHNYLFHKDIVTLASLRKHVEFWMTDHNERIPHSSFQGETPLERFNKTWSKRDEIRIFIGQREAIKLRIQQNQKVTCQLCEIA
jgi:transposase InsO family protein